MSSTETDALATRIPTEDTQRLEEVVEHTALTKSDLVALALDYYMSKNPDSLPAFYDGPEDLGWLGDAGRMSPPSWEEWSGFETR